MHFLLHKQFRTPWFVLINIILYLILHFGLKNQFSVIPLFAAITVGSYRLLADSVSSLLHGSFALDYVAILAIATGIYTNNYLVAAIIVLMMSGGNALEDYAKDKAKHSLTSLQNRIPNQVQVLNHARTPRSTAIEQVAVGSVILIRKGEVVPLDGILKSEQGELDESSLTGEANPVTKAQDDKILSGTVNLGEAITIKTTSSNQDSTYSHIVALVTQAETAKTPFVQLADQLSGVFTIITILIAYGAYTLSGDFERVLAVLVIATPCPLILATPIAMIGGMSAAADERIIFKKLAALEKLAKIKHLVLDKTGTITLGQPQLQKIEVLDRKLTEKEILAIVGGLEKNSLHPFAKAVLHHLEQEQITPKHLTEISEHLGQGISGELDGIIYRFTGKTLYRNQQAIAHFQFADELKADSHAILHKIHHQGIALTVLSGDSIERVRASLQQLPENISFLAGLSPIQKQEKITELQRRHGHVVMVGDGINDAPALAKADVGMVFSHQEHTAASQAADVVMLSGNFQGVWSAITIAKRTMMIAKQSMYVGLGLSMFGMLIASAGLLPPIAGAFGQELIDLAVIFNALRARQRA